MFKYLIYKVYSLSWGPIHINNVLKEFFILLYKQNKNAWVWVLGHSPLSAVSAE